MTRFPTTLLTATVLAGSLLAAAAPAAIAETVSLDRPLAGATLHARGVDVSIYFSEAAGGTYEVVATYVGRDDGDAPHRLVMALSDGDSVRFGLPGRPGVLYAFARSGDVVTVFDTRSPGTRAAATTEAADPGAAAYGAHGATVHGG